VRSKKTKEVQRERRLGYIEEKGKFWFYLLQEAHIT